MQTIIKNDKYFQANKQKLKRKRINSNTSYTDSLFYSKFDKIKELFDEIENNNIDIKLQRILDNDDMLQILMTSAI